VSLTQVTMEPPLEGQLILEIAMLGLGWIARDFEWIQTKLSRMQQPEQDRCADYTDQE
jgi:hypothetical protein